jgi:hypothetical protein
VDIRPDREAGGKGGVVAGCGARFSCEARFQLRTASEGGPYNNNGNIKYNGNNNGHGNIKGKTAKARLVDQAAEGIQGLAGQRIFGLDV